MATTVPYCQLSDLLFGNIPVPTTAGQYLDQGAEEIDSVIGLKYATPVVASDNVEQRPARLLLKRINIWLSTGRCILAISGGGEDDQLHSYGLYLVLEATKALTAIADGTVILPGVPPATETEDRASGPAITNVDNASAVEAFSDVFGNPASNVITAVRPIPYGSNPWLRGW